MTLTLIAMGIAACTSPSVPKGSAQTETGLPHPDTAQTDDGSPSDTHIETVPGSDPGSGSGDEIYDPWTVHAFDLDVSDADIARLRETPRDWVEASLHFRGRTWGPIGIRVKGSSSFQDIDHKPALKLKFNRVNEDEDFFELEGLTLNNEVWDPTMMAENMGYRAFRENGSPAPRTGYATVSLNGRALGLYALIEPMDDDYMDRQWPDTNGGLWEMTRNCDFTGDCSCFDLQETGGAYVEGALVQGCEAVQDGSFAALQAAFNWDEVEAFLATEIAVNHPDSYSYNLNNFFVYHNPTADRLSLSPWGADSTFIYAYPPSTPNPDCRPLYRDDLTGSPVGILAARCRAMDDCRSRLVDKVLSIAQWMETEDLVGEMRRTRTLLDPYAPLETYVNWTVADREQRQDCFEEWTAQRPAELRTWATTQ